MTDLRFIAEIIRASERRLVIEDFHYLNVEERRRFAFDLKALWDYRVYAIVIGVWSQSNLLLHLNPDLTGRVHEITIYWSDDDLARVLDKGGTALDIRFTQAFKDNALNLCYSNVGILQKLTLETLDQAHIKAKQKPPIHFHNDEALHSAALFYADQLNPLYQQFARAVAEGIRTRKDSTGIYAHAMAVIMAATDSKLIRGLNVDEIHEIAHAKQPRIQKGNLKAILEKIESLQVDKDGRGLILDYNETNGDVTVVDRQLLLYRRFCTVRWPWEDLIQEAERQAGEQATGAYGEPAGGSAEAQS